MKLRKVTWRWWAGLAFTLAAFGVNFAGWSMLALGYPMPILDAAGLTFLILEWKHAR